MALGQGPSGCTAAPPSVRCGWMPTASVETYLPFRRKGGGTSGLGLSAAARSSAILSQAAWARRSRASEFIQHSIVALVESADALAIVKLDCIDRQRIRGLPAGQIECLLTQIDESLRAPQRRR